MGDQRPRLSQTEPHLAKKPLTLPHTQANSMECFQVVGQQFTVPELLRVSKLSWIAPQILIHGFPLGLAETSRASFSFAFMQPSKAKVLETLHPTPNSARVLPENISNVIAIEAVSYQQHTMQPMIVAGFLGSQDFLLDRNPHDLFIGDLQFAHVRALLPHNMAGGADESNRIMRHYL
jgi:hypothetical protein